MRFLAGPSTMPPIPSQSRSFSLAAEKRGEISPIWSRPMAQLGTPKGTTPLSKEKSCSYGHEKEPCALPCVRSYTIEYMGENLRMYALLEFLLDLSSMYGSRTALQLNGERCESHLPWIFMLILVNYAMNERVTSTKGPYAYTQEVNWSFANVRWGWMRGKRGWLTMWKVITERDFLVSSFSPLPFRHRIARGAKGENNSKFFLKANRKERVTHVSLGSW